MTTHTDELKSREVKRTNTPSEEETDKSGVEEDDLYNNAEMFSQKNSVISNVIGDILENTINGQRLQIDPSPKWFMNTINGLE